jgi:TRAP-type C4-dicarboxylate transport system permease small subunit
MAKFERVVGALANGLAVGGLSLLMILATFTLLDGVLRAFANYPLDFVRETGDMIAAICGACCLPIALMRESNIVLKVFGKLASATVARVLDLFAAVIVEAVMIGMGWQFYLLGVKTAHAGEVTWLYNLPKAPFWFVVDGILWVAVAVQTYVLVCLLLGVRRNVHSETVA